MEEEEYNEYHDDHRSNFDGSSESIGGPANPDLRGQANFRK
jgi:hypothetical protein